MSYRDDRPSFDEYYLAGAEWAATRGDCRRTKVGAILVSADRVTAIPGYNGTAVPGSPGCLQGACPRGFLDPVEHPPGAPFKNVPGMECTAVHAEMNALTRGSEIAVGGTIYVTRSPCMDCAFTAFEKGVSAFKWRAPDGGIRVMYPWGTSTFVAA